MDQTIVHDALTGSAIALDEHAHALSEKADRAHAHTPVQTLFFPGCSVLNFAPGHMMNVYETLARAGEADGISLLCCGKLLAFEPDAETVRPAFENDMRDALVASGVKRVVAACPNCTNELRRMLAEDERTRSVEVVALPEALAACSAAVEEEAVRAFFEQNGIAYAGDVPKLAVHDSCPDRTTGDFARGTRGLLPAGSLAEMEHNRASSLCCGSLAKAAGKDDVATRQAMRRGEEGERAGADALVCACMSCVSQLSSFQDALPVIHYLEILCNERIGWADLAPYLRVRFLFEEHSGQRDFHGLANAQDDARGACCGATGAAATGEEPAADADAGAAPAVEAAPAAECPDYAEGTDTDENADGARR